MPAALPPILSGTFELRRRLGAGGMGVVYLGWDIVLERLVALKTLSHVGDGGAAALLREARAMATLEHDGLATVYGLERWRCTPILVVEYFPAGTLAARLAKGTLTVREAVRLAIHVADALGYLHGRGLIHRDVSPANIGLTESGMPKLLDFGLAAAAAPAIAAGTRDYMAPEAVGGAPPAPGFDLWSLAMVLVESIGGPSARDAAARSAGADALGRLLPGAPRELCVLVARALSRRPQARFQTADALGRALAAITIDGDRAGDPGKTGPLGAS